MGDNRKSYIWPDPYDPGSYRCIRVYIPNDTIYLAAFWRAYEFFTTWKAWQRDAAHTGSAVAGIWRIGYEMARDALGEDCDDMPYELRDDPDDPCKVQQSLDGGDTWIHAFDKACDDGGGSIPTPTEPPAEKAGNFINNWYVTILNELNSGGTQAEFQDWFCAYMASIGVTGVLATDCELLADGLWSDWSTITDVNIKNELVDPCTHKPKFEELQPCYDEEGVADWLGCAALTILEWLGTEGNVIMHDLSQAALLLLQGEFQAVSDLVQPGGGADFANDCNDGELGCIDFTVSPFGFTRAGDWGVWISGVGWKAQYTTAGAWEVGLKRTSGFPAGTPSNVQVIYNPTGNGKIIELFINGAKVTEQIGGSAGWRQLNWTPTGPITSMEIRAKQNNLNNFLAVTTVCIT